MSETHFEHVERVVKQTVSQCPFCGGPGQLKSRWRTYQSENSGMRSKKQHRFYYACGMCGAASHDSDFAEGALLFWNARPSSEWTPLPHWTASFLLPEYQNYTHLMVHDHGKVSLVDYTNEKNERIDVDLGRFRVCVLKPPFSYILQQELPPGAVSFQVDEPGEGFLPEVVTEAKADDEDEMLDVLEGLVAYAQVIPHNIQAEHLKQAMEWIERKRADVDARRAKHR